MRSKIFFGLTLFGAVVILTAFSDEKRQPTPETVHLIKSIQGPDLYKAYCAVCHGTDAKGNGPMAGSLKIAPSDLTRIAARYDGKYPLPKIRKIISGEELRPGGHGTREMPVWGPIFSQISWDMDLGSVRVDNLARYIEEMQGK